MRIVCLCGVGVWSGRIQKGTKILFGSENFVLCAKGLPWQLRLISKSLWSTKRVVPDTESLSYSFARENLLLAGMRDISITKTKHTYTHAYIYYRRHIYAFNRIRLCSMCTNEKYLLQMAKRKRFYWQTILQKISDHLLKAILTYRILFAIHLCMVVEHRLCIRSAEGIEW